MKTDRTTRKLLKIAKTIKPRRPYEDDKPDGYLESDRDYFDNNRFAAIALLDLALAMLEEVKGETRIS